MACDRTRVASDLATVCVPRREWQTNQALVSLLDRISGILAKGYPRDGTDVLDLDRAYHQARAALRDEHDSYAARRPAPAASIHRRRPCRASVGAIAP